MGHRFANPQRPTCSDATTSCPCDACACASSCDRRRHRRRHRLRRRPLPGRQFRRRLLAFGGFLRALRAVFFPGIEDRFQPGQHLFERRQRAGRTGFTARTGWTLWTRLAARTCFAARAGFALQHPVRPACRRDRACRLAPGLPRGPSEPGRPGLPCSPGLPASPAGPRGPCGPGRPVELSATALLLIFRWMPCLLTEPPLRHQFHARDISTLFQGTARQRGAGQAGHVTSP